MSKTKSLVFIAVFAALIAAGAFVRIDVGPVPFTLQSAFVILAGLTLGAAKGAASVLIYIALGLAGVPVFAAGGGISYVFYPTFGYLLGFAFSAWITGAIFSRIRKKTPLAASLAGLAGVFAVYVIGLPYLFLIREFYLGAPITANVLLINCFLIFLPADIATMLAAAYVATRLRKIKGLII